MAKKTRYDDMNFLEKHVEKLVLLGAVGLLLFAVSHWVLSSPRRVPLARPGRGRMKDLVPPEQADAAVLRAAQEVQRKHLKKTVSIKPLPAIIAHLDALRTMPFEGDPMIAWGLPRQPLSDWSPPEFTGAPIGMMVEVGDLQKIAPKPSTPVARVSRELADTDQGPREWYVAHPVATYSLAELTRIWQEKLDLIILRSEPVLPLAVEVEVRMADSAEADWDAVEPHVATVVRLSRTIRTGVPGETLDAFPVVAESCDKESVKKILDDLGLIDANLAELLQPSYYSVLDETGRQWTLWQKNLARGPVEDAGGEVLKIQRAADGGTTVPVRGGDSRMPPRTAPPRRALPGGTPGRGAPARIIPPEMPPRGAPARGAPARGTPPRNYDRGEPAGARPTRRATRPPVRPVPAKTEEPEPGAKPGVEEEVRPPAFEQQIQAGKVLIWFHDKSLQPGKAYRYRIRLKLRNPLLNHAEDMAVKDKDGKPTDKYVKEAWLTTINTPWSDWSEPVSAVRPLDFFLVESKRAALRGPKAKTGTIKVAVFTRRLGQVVEHVFAVDKGQPIGSKVIKKLRNPPPGQNAAAAAAGAPPAARALSSEMEVDFSTGAVAVDVDFSRAVFKKGGSVKTTEMVYLDEKGRLQSVLWLKDLPAESRRKALYDNLKSEADRAAAEAAGIEAGATKVSTGR